MKKWNFLFYISLLSLLCCQSYAAITHYRATFKSLFTKNGYLKIAIRKFNKADGKYYLVIDPYNFKSNVISTHDISSRKFKYNLQNTPYIKSLFHYSRYLGKLDNSGLAHAAKPIKGFFLTVDMCPSTKRFDKRFYQKLISNNQKPFPVAIAISGLWLLQHKRDFKWLLRQQKQGKLAITWVNHSFNHLYRPNLAKSRNFMLHPSVNLQHEIFKTEIALLNAGQVPSVLFRFPGLVANKRLLKKLVKYGLIPLGADAWLSNSQKPTRGSVILVHANGNDRSGIAALMKYLNNPRYHWFAITRALPTISSQGERPPINTIH